MDGMLFYFELCLREYVQGDICGFFGILSMFIFIDFFDFIIYEFKFLMKNERVLNIFIFKL